MRLLPRQNVSLSWDLASYFTRELFRYGSMDRQTICREPLEERLGRIGRMAMFMPEGEKRIFAPKVQDALQRRKKSVSSGVTDQDPICFTLNPFGVSASESSSESRSEDRDSLSTLIPNFLSLR